MGLASFNLLDDNDHVDDLMGSKSRGCTRIRMIPLVSALRGSSSLTSVDASRKDCLLNLFRPLPASVLLRNPEAVSAAERESEDEAFSAIRDFKSLKKKVLCRPHGECSCTP